MQFARRVVIPASAAAPWRTGAQEFFDAVQNIQVTILESERVRLQALERLSALLALQTAGSVDGIAEALRIRARSEKEQGRAFQLHVNLRALRRYTDANLTVPRTQLDEESRAETWVNLRPWGEEPEAYTQPLDDLHCEHAEERAARLHRRHAQDRQLTGASDEAVADGLCVCLRTLVSVQRRLSVVANVAPLYRDRGRRFQAQLTPALRESLGAEFRAALEQLDAAPAEAEAQAGLAEAAIHRMRLAVDVVDEENE